MAKNKSVNIEPCDVIFNYVDKPNNFLMCKNVNVYDDRWRINIYSKRYVDDIEGKCISASYFVQFNSNNNTINILS